MNADRKWLADPRIVQVNRLAPHSDHSFFLSEPAAESGRNPWRQSLSGDWYFEWAATPDAGDPEFYLREDPASAMDTIPVPCHMEMAGYGQPQYTNTTYPWDGSEVIVPPQIPREYNPTGRYLRTWTMPEEWQGHKVHLTFEGAESALFVWVNGHFAGYSEDSFTPAEFDVTEWLKPGENRIAAEVVKWCTGSWMEDQDFFRFSGLFRDVVIYAVPDCHVRDLFVRQAFPEGIGGPAVLTLETSLEGESLCGEAEVRLLAPDGNRAFNGRFSVGKENRWEIRVGNPILWNGENPVLYTLQIRLFGKDGRLLELASQRTGLRQVEIRDGIFCLNGQRLIFRGVNRHEFSCTAGRAIGEEDMRRDLRILKEMNINAVRTCHYPNQSRFIELCDEAGIYLIDETNLESHGTWAAAVPVQPEWNVPGGHPEWKEAALDRARNMLERDKNHPSVLLWSLGNESFAGENMREMAKFLRSRDGSRPVHYEGVCHCREFDDISDVESRMYLPPDGVAEYLESSPGKPFMLCEYMHSMGNSCGGMKSYTDMEDRYPMYMGGFIWDYLDQALLTENEDGVPFLGYGGDFDDHPNAGNFSGDGLLYADRRLSPKAAEAKALYAPVRITVSETKVRIENRRFFTDTGIYHFTAEYYEDGVLKESRVLPVPAVSPGETAELPHGFQKEKTKETTIRVLANLAEDEAFLSAGHEAAFGEWTGGRTEEPGFLNEENLPQVCGTVSETGDEFRVIPGWDTLGVRGRNFHYRFPLGPGDSISLRRGDRELLAGNPRLIFWRAITDNDRAAGSLISQGFWQAADHGQTRVRAEWKTDEQGCPEVTYEYRLPGGAEYEPVRLAYRVLPDGTLEVRTDWPQMPVPEGPPALGVEFRLKKSFSRLTYFGLGPEENYIDRNHGVKLGLYETTPADSMARYLKPQECGNHTGVRQLTLTDEDGRGLQFSALTVPMEASALPWSSRQLEEAEHRFELPEPSYTWVRILACQQGVGGIDTWGARPEKQYLLDSGIRRTFSFAIRPL